MGGWLMLVLRNDGVMVFSPAMHGIEVGKPR